MVKKKIRRKNKLDKWFLLNGKKVFIIMISWFVAVLLHNLVYGLFKSWFDARGGDESFFFIIAVILIPIYFIIGIVYSFVWMIRNEEYPRKKFYIKLLVSIILGLIVTFVLTTIHFLNFNGFWMSLIVFTILIFGLISLFQKKR